MTDQDRFETLMRDAARTYRTPPEPDLDEMWNDIESRMASVAAEQGTNVVALPTKRRPFHRQRWVQIAATLVVGIGLGRASMMLGHRETATPLTTESIIASTPPLRDSVMARPYELETSQYLGQATALLVGLPGELKNNRGDQQFAKQASDLLSRTRLLLDSPAADDPSMRSLFEDLELVLAQVVRLQNKGNGLELDLIHRALEQRDVIPRLRTAAADISAN